MKHADLFCAQSPLGIKETRKLSIVRPARDELPTHSDGKIQVFCHVLSAAGIRVLQLGANQVTIYALVLSSKRISPTKICTYVRTSNRQSIKVQHWGT